MELIEVILSKENLNRAYKKVVANKGAGGVDGVAVEELGNYIREKGSSVKGDMEMRINGHMAWSMQKEYL